MASKSNTQLNFPVDLLKCCCCSSLFDEGIRQPRLLPCLHSVCFHCLQSNIKSKAKIGCKYCQEETDVIDKTVEQFPTNGTQDGFVKLYKIKNSEHFLQCQECEDEPTAEFLCETCPKQLCKDCHEHHKRAKRSHVLFSLQDMPLTFDSAKKLSSARKCQMKGHDGENLTFYCNSCKQIVCSKCILVAHKEGHTLLNLHTTYETEVQNIEKETKTLDVIENKMNNIKDLVESEIVNVEETSDRISTEIETAFEKVIETLNCRKQELMDELRHKTKIKTRRLKDQAFHLKKQISIISSTQSSIQLALSTSDSVSLIDAAPFIIEKTLSLRDIQIDKEPCEKPTLAFVKTPLGHDSLLGKFISVSISGSRSQVIVPDVGVVGEETEIKVNLFDDDGNVVNDKEMDVCLKISDSHNTVVHTISCYLTENRTWLGKNIFNTDGRYEIVVVVLGVKLEMVTTTIDIENAPVIASAQVEVNTQDMNRGLDNSIKKTYAKYLDHKPAYVSYEQLKFKEMNRQLETNVQQPSRDNWLELYKDSVTSRDERFVGTKFQFYTKEGLKVKLHRGSITSLNVDAIVNTANGQLRNVGVGGLAQAISNAAGKALEDGCRKQIRIRKWINVSENCVTVSGDLPCRFVIHAVGPNWHNYRDKKKCLIDLCQTVVNILKTSQEERFKVVGMPPISSGFLSVPQRLCAAMYLKAITDFSQKCTWNRHVEELHIIDIEDEMLNLIQDVYQKWKQDPSCIDPEKLARGYSSYHTSYLSENKWGGLRISSNTPKVQGHIKGQYRGNTYMTK